jgi:hypothetical protein
MSGVEIQACTYPVALFRYRIMPQELKFEQCGGFHPFPRFYPDSKINGGRLGIEKVFHFLAV